MEKEFQYPVRVEFADTDAAGVAHFSRLLAFVEAAEHAYLGWLGVAVMAECGGGRSGWPRVDVSFEFKGALRFRDEAVVAIRLERLGERSVCYRAEMRTVDGRLVCSGTMTNAFVVMGVDHSVKSAEISGHDRRLFLNELERLNG